MEPSNLKRLISRYQSGKASPAERYIVESWLESFQDDEPNIAMENAGFLDIFQKGVINRAIVNQQSLHTHRYRRGAWAIAALLLCIVSFSLTFYIRQAGTLQSSVSQKLSTNGRHMKRFVLPDSTVVYLNTNSSLEIANSFGKFARKVSLKGEAYFEVTRDTSKPFTVQTEGLAIKVLGTSFNVNAHHSLGNISVAVNSGEVQVSDSLKTLAVLHAEEGLTYNQQDKDFRLMQVLPIKESSWWKGVNVLRSASFTMLAQVLYSCYGVTLQSEDPALRKLTYTFTVRSTRTLEQTMDQISAMLHKKYRKEGNKVILY